MYKVPLTDVIKKMKLINLTPEVDINHIMITRKDIDRPALQLTGLIGLFYPERIQVLGNAEYAYLEKLESENKSVAEALERIFIREIPCLVLCRNRDANIEMLELAAKYNIPVLKSKQNTSIFIAEIIRWLNVELADRVIIHGVLVDVYGEGVLIIGEGGIGKSETAVELIRRGHRLVSDDVVEIKKVSEETLIGYSPILTKHFIELRGIGFVDVKALFGIESVKDTQAIDLVIKLEEWDRKKEYDSFCLEESYEEFMGNKVVCHEVPVRPGRNLAVIVETAAIDHRQKKMGYNATQELYKRMISNNG